MLPMKMRNSVGDEIILFNVTDIPTRTGGHYSYHIIKNNKLATMNYDEISKYEFIEFVGGKE